MVKSDSIFRVSTSSSPSKLAGALTAYIRDNKTVATIHVIGGGAVNQAIKGIAIARGFLVPSGVDIVVQPSFSVTQIEGSDRTQITLSVIPIGPDKLHAQRT